MMFVKNIAVIFLVTFCFFLVWFTPCDASKSTAIRQAGDDPEPDGKSSINDKCKPKDPNDDTDEEKSRRKRSFGVDKKPYHYWTNKLSTTTSAPENVTIDLDRFSEEFLNCVKWKIEVGCYEIISNGSAYVEIYSRAFNDSDYYIDPEGGLYVCSSMGSTPDARKFDEAFDIVSIVGMSISMICIVLHMIMFLLVPSLRNLPGYSLISLCVSLLLSYSTIFLRATIDEDQDCSGFGMSIMYFMLTAFFWMNVLSYDVWRSLRLATTRLRVSTHLWFRFAVYSLYAWGGPVLIMITAVVIDKAGDVPPEYRLLFNQVTCWFEYRQALLMYFVIPMFALLFCNLVFFVWSFIMISSASMKNSENKGILTIRFAVLFRLFVIMGLSWIFGSVAAATDLMVFWYLFAIANCLQGVMIFLSFSFGKKTISSWKAFKNKRKISACPTQCSLHTQQCTEIN